MALRYNPLESVRVKSPEDKIYDFAKISSIFGENVFNLKAMQEYLAEGAYLSMLACIKGGSSIDFKTAEDVAKGLKKWAMDRGATHFTHWFQPLTHKTAEKHDSFYKPSLDFNVLGVEKFSAAELVQREPDASSFPNGGLRNTAEARGYTIWDPSSFAFILETKNGKTLYIPSVFISYTGEALDNKMPLLRSAELLNRAATAVCHYFDDSIRSVTATLGWEQEYFLVDKLAYFARPDLVLCGRTVFGGASPKGQQKEDHYFGTIPERIQQYMVDFEREALRVGVPITTRHNEVAPGQYECAPMFEELNSSVDHNLLIMDLMTRVADRHNLRVLFHEKPFAGVNGSGKHNNWSMATNEGKNLLNPGDDPSNDLRFLTFFVNTIRAIDRYEEVLRAGIAIPGNDHRLGANEAPPAIISVFTGAYMKKVLDDFVIHGLRSDKLPAQTLNTGIPRIPEITLDNTDRNRTSPFPFTGNKFEFRAVGSSTSCSTAMTYLNTIVADQLIEFKKDVDAKVAKGTNVTDAMVAVLQHYIKASERIIFNGNGYSPEWEVEAAKRGLSNNKNTPRALAALTHPETIKLFEKNGVLTPRELHARFEVQLEDFIKTVEIEMNVIDQLDDTHIIPAVMEHINRLCTQHDSLKNMGLKDEAEYIKGRVKRTVALLKDIDDLEIEMRALAEKAHTLPNIYDTAVMFAEQIRPYFDKIRAHADDLEILVDDNLWKLPKYREMLFIH